MATCREIFANNRTPPLLDLLLCDTFVEDAENLYEPLVDYCLQANNTAELLEVLLKEPDPDSELELDVYLKVAKWFKIEEISEDITDIIFDNTDLLDKFNAFFGAPGALSAGVVLSATVVLMNMCEKDAEQLCAYLVSKRGGFMCNVASHTSHPPFVELMVRLLYADEDGRLAAHMAAANVMDELTTQLAAAESCDDVALGTCHVIAALVSLLEDKEEDLARTMASVQPLLDNLASSDNVRRLYKFAVKFDAPADDFTKRLEFGLAPAVAALKHSINPADEPGTSDNVPLFLRLSLENTRMILAIVRQVSASQKDGYKRPDDSDSELDSADVAKAVRLPRLGVHRLRAIEWLARLCACNYSTVQGALAKEGVYDLLLEQFFQRPWCNIVHDIIGTMLKEVLEREPGNEPLKAHLFLDCKLHARLVRAAESREPAIVVKGGGKRARGTNRFMQTALMGHVVQLCNVISNKVENEVRKVRKALGAHAEWQAFKKDVVAEHTRLHNTPIGGKASKFNFGGGNDDSSSDGAPHIQASNEFDADDVINVSAFDFSGGAKASFTVEAAISSSEEEDEGARRAAKVSPKGGDDDDDDNSGSSSNNTVEHHADEDGDDDVAAAADALDASSSDDSEPPVAPLAAIIAKAKNSAAAAERTKTFEGKNERFAELRKRHSGTLHSSGEDVVTSADIAGDDDFDSDGEATAPSASTTNGSAAAAAAVQAAAAKADAAARDVASLEAELKELREQRDAKRNKGEHIEKNIKRYEKKKEAERLAKAQRDLSLVHKKVKKLNSKIAALESDAASAASKAAAAAKEAASAASRAATATKSAADTPAGKPKPAQHRYQQQASSEATRAAKKLHLRASADTKGGCRVCKKRCMVYEDNESSPGTCVCAHDASQHDDLPAAARGDAQHLRVDSAGSTDGSVSPRALQLRGELAREYHEDRVLIAAKRRSQGVSPPRSPRAATNGGGGGQVAALTSAFAKLDTSKPSKAAPSLASKPTRAAPTPAPKVKATEADKSDAAAAAAPRKPTLKEARAALRAKNSKEREPLEAGQTRFGTARPADMKKVNATKAALAAALELSDNEDSGNEGSSSDAKEKSPRKKSAASPRKLKSPKSPKKGAAAAATSPSGAAEIAIEPAAEPVPVQLSAKDQASLEKIKSELCSLNNSIKLLKEDPDEVDSIASLEAKCTRLETKKARLEAKRFK